MPRASTMSFRYHLAALLLLAALASAPLHGQSFEIPATALIRPLGIIVPAPCSQKVSQVCEGATPSLFETLNGGYPMSISGLGIPLGGIGAAGLHWSELSPYPVRRSSAKTVPLLVDRGVVHCQRGMHYALGTGPILPSIPSGGSITNRFKQMCRCDSSRRLWPEKIDDPRCQWRISTCALPITLARQPRCRLCLQWQTPVRMKAARRQQSDRA